MNKAIIVGRLVRDPEVRYTQTGKVVATFTLAVDRYTGQDGKKEADFIPVVVWGKIAEICGNSLTKGQKVLVDGRIQTRSYEAKDGSKRYVTEIIAGSVEFLERRQNAPDAANEFGNDLPPEDDIPF